jgi:hypothetical protein
MGQDFDHLFPFIKEYLYSWMLKSLYYLMKLDGNCGLWEELLCLRLETMEPDSFLFVVILAYYFVVMYFGFIRLSPKQN